MEESVVMHEWHDRVASEAAVRMMMGRVDTCVYSRTAVLSLPVLVLLVLLVLVLVLLLVLVVADDSEECTYSYSSVKLLKFGFGCCVFSRIMGAWEMDLERQEALDLQASGMGGPDNAGIGKRQRDVKNVFAQAKAVELQRSEAALREWLEKERTRQESVTDHHTL